jgi:hypothetical protein
MARALTLGNSTYAEFRREPLQHQKKKAVQEGNTR